MNTHEIIDKPSMSLKDSTKVAFIPFLGGRPERSAVIGRDDILDLTIILNTTRSVDEFLTLL